MESAVAARRGIAPAAQAPQAGPAKEFLTFRVGTEEYAVEIQGVREIRGYERPTRIVNSPAAVKGVVNLRGVVIPVVDLRIHFGIPEPGYDDLTVVIIVDFGGRMTGVVVDSVSDVLALPPAAIHPAPGVSGSDPHTHVRGLGTIGQRMLILLDLEQLLGGSALALPQ